MNVLITGTPGTGKTTLSLKIADRTKMTHVNVSDLVKSERLYETFDRKFESYLIDEKRLLRKLRPLIRKGNIIVDTHQCSMFPAKWFDLVVVLTVDNTNLYDRLKARYFFSLHI